MEGFSRSAVLVRQFTKNEKCVTMYTQSVGTANQGFPAISENSSLIFSTRFRFTPKS